MQETPTYFRYWGKASGADTSESETPYHLLPFHSLDVAAVGYFLLDPKESLCRRLSQQLSVSPLWLQEWFSFCLMLHDLGKFFRSFQNLAPNLSKRLVAADSRCLYTTRHDTLGFLLWTQTLAHRVADLMQGVPPTKLSPWIEIVCGHHGQPPEQTSQTNRHLQSFLLDEDINATENFFRDLANFWMPNLEPLTSIPKNRFKQLSWELAGVAVLSDWLGSNQNFFHYRTVPESLDRYWSQVALPQAEKAITYADFRPRSIAPFTNIKQQFPFVEAATPLQHYAETVTLNEAPQLFILEDVTGSGKTEAAMVLVHRLMAAGSAEGVYIGLPTMATANAMYERMQHSYRALYLSEVRASLVLSHGARDLSESFRASVVLSEQASDRSYGANESSASAYCNQWLADNKKKALLADIGVGTIDQALLAVLPARFQSLRLLGLSNKVLLVDEVHAYDPYMRQLLMSLLEAHAAHQGCAILLSATLPASFKRELILAYAKGAGSVLSQFTLSHDYPLATLLAADDLCETKVATREAVRRTVKVKRVEAEDSALCIVRDAVQSGLCVCWIRNTVKDARNTWRCLSEQQWVVKEKLTLFHSRFAMSDRQHIEQRVMATFGKHSLGSNRGGHVLIATQVVEQSLDLDFDVLITDLAPVDLLIQRAGRLQRHVRTAKGDPADSATADGRICPTLHILAPDPEQVIDEHWLRKLLPGTQAVYPHVGQLWLSVRTILKCDGFTMPDDARRLIEDVYSEEMQSIIPESLSILSGRAEGVQRGDAAMGVFNCLNLSAGYTRGMAGQHSHWDEEVHVPTRLTENSVAVALARPTHNGLAPYAKHADTGSAWALSQLSIPQEEWRKVKKMIPLPLARQIDELKQNVHGLRWVEIFPLVEAGETYYESVAGWSS